MVKIMQNPIKMDDLGVPLFLETPIYLLYTYFILTFVSFLQVNILDMEKDGAGTGSLPQLRLC